MMGYQAIDSKIEEYLLDTVSIRDKFIETQMSNKVDSNVITPWSLAQICANLNGVSEENLLDFVSRYNDTLILDADVYGKRILLKAGKNVPELQRVDLPRHIRIIDSLSSCRVSDAFSILLLEKVTELTVGLSNWVKKEDAIFGIKNSLMIPDDFMPPSWMLIVENDEPITSLDVLDDISIISGEKSLYVYSSMLQGVPVRPLFFYPRKSSGIKVTLAEDDVASRITESFSKMRSSESFDVFAASRSIKNAIFNLQAKNTRELKKPMFDTGKLGLMIRDGLVSERDGKFFLNDSIDLAELVRIQSEYKRESAKLARTWLDSTFT
ncbi:MAG: hypothetical protein QW597_04970 [Thermoplasmataceae archaeon]